MLFFKIKISINVTCQRTNWLTYCLTDWLTDRLTAQLPGWLTDWLAGWLTDRPTDRLACWLADWLDWLTDRPAGWLAYDWLTDWLTDPRGGGYFIYDGLYWETPGTNYNATNTLLVENHSSSPLSLNISFGAEPIMQQSNSNIRNTFCNEDSYQPCWLF